MMDIARQIKAQVFAELLMKYSNLPYDERYKIYNACKLIMLDITEKEKQPAIEILNETLL